MKKTVILLFSVFFIIAACISAGNEVFGISFTAHRQRNTINSGEIKALAVRLGYSDHPLNDTNKYYSLATEEYIRAAFEGSSSETGLPYGGVKTFFENSSFGKMSVTLGDIIDIQMDDTLESYIWPHGLPENDSEHTEKLINRPEYKGPFSDYDEFERKLLEKINIEDYDSDHDGIIDALYVLDTSDHEFAYYGYTNWSYIAPDSSVSQSNVWISLRNSNDLKELTNVLIHESGHLLLDLYDYYDQNGFETDEIRSVDDIMSRGSGDFDAVAKWHMGWLDENNVTRIYPKDGETGEVFLSPSDSDSDQGKKIAIINFKDSVYIEELDIESDIYYDIAVEYVSGSNNNDFPGKSAPEGFRFYLIEGTPGEQDIIADHAQLVRGYLTGKYEKNLPDRISYRVLNEYDTIENLFDLGLDITEIRTGDNPSFTYHYTKKEDVAIPVTDLVTYADYSVLYEQVARISDEFKDVDFIPVSVPEEYYDKYTAESIERLESALIHQYGKYMKVEQYIVDQNTLKLKKAIDGLELKPEEQTEQQTEQSADISGDPEGSSSDSDEDVPAGRKEETVNGEDKDREPQNKNENKEPVREINKGTGRTEDQVKTSTAHRTYAPQTGAADNNCLLWLTSIVSAVFMMSIVLYKRLTR